MQKRSLITIWSCLSLSFHSKDTKQFWKVVRHFVKGNCTSSSIPPLNSFPVTGQSEFCFASADKAELLNKNFTSISTVNDENVVLPAFEYKCLDYPVLHVHRMELHLSLIFKSKQGNRAWWNK